ncbi:MAG TPA: hypothetical protein VE136_07560, partial [Anaerolineales bacterium]|nr:hypothetical protein [Anaerolineales bacterium]
AKWGWRVGPVVALLVGLVLTGCALFNPLQQPTQVPVEAHTQAAETLAAQITQAAPTQTPLPTATQPPGTFTPTPTSIPLAGATVAPVETQPPVETPQVTETPAITATQPVPTSAGNFTVALQDDFTPNTGWYTSQGEDFGFEYAQGGYRIYVNIRSAPIWSIRQRDYGDVRLEVDATQTGGPLDGYFGVVCRLDRDKRDYYALVISTDGTYGIAKSENNEYAFLEQGSAPAGVINSGESVNRVRGECLGDTLTLSANGQQLLQVRDDSFDSGWIGLIAGTRQEPDLVVLFDNFVALRP